VRRSIGHVHTHTTATCDRVLQSHCTRRLAPSGSIPAVCKSSHGACTVPRHVSARAWHAEKIVSREKTQGRSWQLRMARCRERCADVDRCTPIACADGGAAATFLVAKPSVSVVHPPLRKWKKWRRRPSPWLTPAARRRRYYYFRLTAAVYIGSSISSASVSSRDAWPLANPPDRNFFWLSPSEADKQSKQIERDGRRQPHRSSSSSVYKPAFLPRAQFYSSRMAYVEVAAVHGRNCAAVGSAGRASMPCCLPRLVALSMCPAVPWVGPFLAFFLWHPPRTHARKARASWGERNPRDILLLIRPHFATCPHFTICQRGLHSTTTYRVLSPIW
jgi:hypothetical protein